MAATTTEQNEALVHRIVEEVWNAGDLAVVDEFYAEKFVGHVLGADDLLLGPEDYRGWVRDIRDGFPDLTVTVDEMFSSDEVVCGQWTLTGTNEGGLTPFDPPSTGNSVEYSGLFIARIQDGAVVEEWNVSDTVTALQQLGHLPEPTAE